MRDTPLTIYEELALADLRSWLADRYLHEDVLRRQTSLLIVVSFPTTRLERWAELRDGMVGDSLIVAAASSPALPVELRSIARKADGDNLRIDSYDTRLDQVLGAQGMPSAESQYMTTWSRSEISRAVEASSHRIQAVWERLSED